MHNRALCDALRDLGREVGALIRRELDGGADLPFEVLEAGGGSEGGPVLYRYRPLTAAFVAERWPLARGLDPYRRAVRLLGAHAAGPYLRHRGLSGSDPDVALRDLMERLFDEATSFDMPEERFGRLHAEIDATLADAAVEARVVAPLHGVRIASARVDLGDGLFLARRSAAGAPPAAIEGAVRASERTAEADDAGDAIEPESDPLDVFCLLEREVRPGARLPVDTARPRFRRVLTALRLCGAGGTALGPLAWARAGEGAWHPVALGVSARARAESWELRAADEQELRDLLEVLTLSRHDATVGWALDRFEMGCERGLEVEALSDYLLGLRALVGDAGNGLEPAIAGRLAALCAPAADRPDAEGRVRLAFTLERQVIHGGGPALESPRGVVREAERHLRALLRDVLCGYLEPDLRRVADEILAATAYESELDAELRVHDARAVASPS
ncbi:MAG: hypothetical protein ACR2IN_05980 [Thermoleophilaceae bacterium]